MSTKDLIERLNRTQTTTRRSAKTEGDGDAPVDAGGRRVTTRVGARVIRRRKNTEKAPPPAALPTAVAKSAAPEPEAEVAAEAAVTPEAEAPEAAAEASPAPEAQEAPAEVVEDAAAEITQYGRIGQIALQSRNRKLST